VEWGEGHEWTNDPSPKEGWLRVDYTSKVQLTNKMVEMGKEFLSTKSPRLGVKEMCTTLIPNNNNNNNNNREWDESW
jgi:hypothetical protein